MTRPFFETAILHSQLVPWKHYLPLADDFSDLQKVLDWAGDNPTAVARMAIEGQTYFHENLESDRQAEQVSAAVLAVYLDRVRVTYTADTPEADLGWYDVFYPDPRAKVEHTP